MKTRILWCLVGINIALAIMVLLPRVRDNTAIAQRIDRPADYLLIPGEVSGADRGVVFIVDSSNGAMSAITFEDSTGRLEVMPPSDLNRIFEEGVAAVPGRRNRTR